MSQELGLETSTKTDVKSNAEIAVKEMKSAIAFLSAGIGLLMVSIFNLLQGLTGGLKGPVGKFLTLHEGIGPYSGKQVYSLIIWMAVWFVLNKTLVNKNFRTKKIMLWAYIVIGVAALLVFPPFLELIVG